MVAAVPETVVGGLVAKDLVSPKSKDGVILGEMGKQTSMRPTTIERLGICKPN